MRAAIALLFVSTAAYAQDAGQLAQGLAAQPIAYMLALVIGVVVYQSRRIDALQGQILTEKDAQLALAKSHAEALASARSEGALLARQLGDGLAALEDVMQHMTRVD